MTTTWHNLRKRQALWDGWRGKEKAGREYNAKQYVGRLEHRCHHPLFWWPDLATIALDRLIYATESWTRMYEKAKGKATCTAILTINGTDWLQWLHLTRHQGSLLLSWITQMMFNGWTLTIYILTGSKRRIKIHSLENYSWPLMLKSEMDTRWKCCSLQQGHGSWKPFWGLMFS